MPKFISTQGDQFEVEYLDRRRSGTKKKIFSADDDGNVDLDNATVGGAKVMAGAPINTVVVTGADASGGAEDLTATGLAVGDTVVGAINITDGTEVSGDLESVVTVADQITQSSGSNHLNDKIAVIVVQA